MSEPLPQTWRELAVWLRHAPPGVWLRLSLLAMVLISGIAFDLWAVLHS